MGSFEDKKVTGNVFNVQKYSVHDGPGIRTVVFLKGCPLRCKWCSNPESQKKEFELAYNVGRCLTLNKCVRCLEVCTRNAIGRNPDGTLNIDRSLCGDCPNDCATACPAQGVITYGKTMTVGEVIDSVEQDSLFYARSGGGMTLSGGEPLFQSEFALALLREARLRRIKPAIESSALVSWELFEEVCSLLSVLLMDIKHIDSAKHKEGTGVPNERILENFKKAATQFPDLPILARTAIVPGFNDNEETIRAIAELIKPFPNVTYEVLAYHRLGTQKYLFLDRTCEMGDVTLDNDVYLKLEAVAKEVLGDRLVKS